MDYIEFYVDGSYSRADQKKDCIAAWGYTTMYEVPEHGVVSDSGILTIDSPMDIISGCQIGGEIKSAMEAISKGHELGAKTIVIKYDYEGIEKWATHLWKTNKEYTKAYVDWIDFVVAQWGVTVIFFKTPRDINHADGVAKEAIQRARTATA